MSVKVAGLMILAAGAAGSGAAAAGTGEPWQYLLVNAPMAAAVLATALVFLRNQQTERRELREERENLAKDTRGIIGELRSTIDRHTDTIVSLREMVARLTALVDQRLPYKSGESHERV